MEFLKKNDILKSFFFIKNISIMDKFIQTMDELIVEMKNESIKFDFNQYNKNENKLKTECANIFNKYRDCDINMEELFYEYCQTISYEIIELWFNDLWKLYNQSNILPDEFWSEYYNLNLQVESIVQEYFT